MEKYRVIVGNIGTVYAGGIHRTADQCFEHYRDLSKAGVGRGAGEGVLMLERGRIKREFVGSLGDVDDRIDFVDPSNGEVARIPKP